MLRLRNVTFFLRVGLYKRNIILMVVFIYEPLLQDSEAEDGLNCGMFVVKDVTGATC